MRPVTAEDVAEAERIKAEHVSDGKSIWCKPCSEKNPRTWALAGHCPEVDNVTPTLQTWAAQQQWNTAPSEATPRLPRPRRQPAPAPRQQPVGQLYQSAAGS